MRAKLTHVFVIAFSILASSLIGANLARAQQPACDARALGQLIDETAQTLRTLNRDSERRFQDRLLAISKEKGWSDAIRATRANEAMDENRLAAFNAEIEPLATKLDSLSVVPATGGVSCQQLTELKGVRERLVTVMTQKSKFILSQLDTLSRSQPQKTAANTPPLPPPAPPASNPPASPPDNSWSANVARTPPPASPAPPVPPQQRPTSLSPIKPAPSEPQQTGGDRYAYAPPSQTPLPGGVPPLPPSPLGYNEQEIRDAGRGVFGTLTSEFAIVINHAFKKYGQPNGYIIGDEGGGAFLAGLRYGDGQLYTRVNGVESGPTKIYWQGPSFGVDIGATGSRTLFLVYNLDTVPELYQRFSGIDGTAYVAGGFGLTVLGNGRITVVPIRTGLGLRLGASLAYLKFTDKQRLNPF